MEIKPIPVSSLAEYLKKIIASEEILINIRVVGEVADFTLRKNIAYFGIKDDFAYLSCISFNANIFSVLKNGDKVVLTGSPNYYVKGGKLNFQVNVAEPLGQGDKYLQFIKLKEKLESKGYFDLKRKKNLPQVIKNVGIITSLDGAVIRDICSVVGRRNPFLNLKILDCAVQGQTAQSQIAEAIKTLDELHFDCIIIARGGGSLEDLSVFNSEIIADEIFAAITPIISAVGHETDFTICDFVADARAATPSVAAELISKNVFETFEIIKDNLKKSTKYTEYMLKDKQEFLISTAKNLNVSITDKISEKNYVLSMYAESMSDNVLSSLNKAEQSYNLNFTKLEKLNPLLVLKRGFGKVLKNNSPAIIKDINIGDEIDVVMLGGSISTKIISKKEV